VSLGLVKRSLEVGEVGGVWCKVGRGGGVWLHFW